MSAETKAICRGLILAATIMVAHRPLAASPAPVDLGSAAGFTILAYSAITSTGGGAVNGDVGLSPTTGGSITGLSKAQVSGTIYAVDSSGPTGSVADPDLLTAAKAALDTAYNDAAGRLADRITLTADENLGGQTLAPGLYGSASSLRIAGDLTLDANGDPNAVWIFQMGSTLTTAAGSGASRVILADGARSRNVFWQVGSSATIGTFSVFKGTIMAAVSITLDTSSTVDGRALARGGQVTFNGASAASPPTSSGIDLRAFQGANGVYVEFVAYDVESEGLVTLTLLGADGNPVWSGTANVVASPAQICRILVPGLTVGGTYDFAVRDEVGTGWPAPGVTVSAFATELLRLAPTGMTLAFSSLPGRVYEIQWVDRIGATWQAVTALLADNDRTSVLVAIPDPKAPAGFFRVVLK